MQPRDVYSKTVSLLDWFFMQGGIVTKKNLQILGIASLGIAMKLNQSGIRIVPVDPEIASKNSIIQAEI